MSATLKRQLKDIDHQAERLLNGNPSWDEIEQFAQYSEELKAYLLEEVDEKMIRERAFEIPNILAADLSEQVTSGIINTIVLLFTSFFSGYFRERKKINAALDKIRDVRSRYSSIEFLYRNVPDKNNIS